MKNNIKEITTTFLLIVTALLLLNPFHFWMPDMLLICILAILLVLFGIFTNFVLRERTFDERDSLHRTIAGRNSFIGGSIIIMIGIVVQGYNHMVDPWLIIALIVMVVTKISSRIWSDK